MLRRPVLWMSDVIQMDACENCVVGAGGREFRARAAWFGCH